jgi:F420H(2)-dependent quinone reductase
VLPTPWIKLPPPAPATEPGAARLDPKRVARLTHGGARWRRSSAAWSRLHARLFRLSGGRLLPRWFGAPVVVLETVGRRSGKPRATPVIRAKLDSSYVVMPSNAGSDRTPAWWLNLEAAGEATVIDGRQRVRVRPRILGGNERKRGWEALLAAYPAAQEYLRFTDRKMPLVALDPSPKLDR